MANTPTENHDYSKPAEGDADWDTTLNQNFDALDADMPIVDDATTIQDGVTYTYNDNQLAFATDTGAVLLGDPTGSAFQPFGNVSSLAVQQDGANVFSNPEELNFTGAASAASTATGVDVEIEEYEDWSLGGTFNGNTTDGAAEAGPLSLEYLITGQTITIHKASLFAPDQQALPSGVEIIIATGSGGTLTWQSTAITSDNTTLANNHQESEAGLASYTAGSDTTVGIYIDNGFIHSTRVEQDFDFHTTGEYRITG